MAKTNNIPGMKGKGLSELWSRLRFLLLAIFVYRVGTYIPIPGMNPDAVSNLFSENQGTLMDMFNMFTGGAAERMSILALGIMPYISASIIMQIMTQVTPSLEQLKKEGDAGRRKINQYTRYFTVVLALVQGFAISNGFAGQSWEGEASFSFLFVATVSLVTGAVFMMWLGEQITEFGIGNGISMLIFAGIVAGLPPAIGQLFTMAQNGDIGVPVLIGFLILAISVIWLIVRIERGQRRITVNYAKRQKGRQMMAAQSSHLPLKVNMAGVIPAIFASSILLFPATITNFIGQGGEGRFNDILIEITAALGIGQPLYLILFTVAIIFFCFFYTALMFNPKEVAENLQKSGAYIPGIRPGIQTANYIDGVLTRLTVFGSIYIAAVCLLPNFLNVWFSVPLFFGGTSLLIVVVVVMDLFSQIQSHLMSSQYESLMKKANLKNYGTAR
jgi:preprotein translocase subunit SecY